MPGYRESLSTMATSVRFTDDELLEYFTYIEVPLDYRYATKYSLRYQDKSSQINFINILLRHQLTHVPWENLDLHYASVKGISLDPKFLFRKIVTSKLGRGGYCMQNNLFFATVLSSLGFVVTSHGARVAKTFGVKGQKSPAEEVQYGGYGHQVNIVTFDDGSRYFCDVGFGSAGPTFLVPMEDGYWYLNTGTPVKIASTMILKRGWTADNVTRIDATKLWIYMVKYGALHDDKDWNVCYCFNETEFTKDDFERMSWHVSTSRTSMFVNQVLVQKFIMSEDGEHLIGDVTLVDRSIKRRMFGVSEELMDIKSESDRVQALRRFLGIELLEDEKAAIQGFPTMVKSEPTQESGSGTHAA